MKYSELKSYLELACWENESDEYYIKMYRNGYNVAEVGLCEQYNIKVYDPTQMTEGLYRRLTNLANTPLAEREEEKRYLLMYSEPALLKDSGRDKVYLYKRTQDSYYNVSSDKKNTNAYQTIFSESEIAQMDITGFEKIEVTS